MFISFLPHFRFILSNLYLHKVKLVIWVILNTGGPKMLDVIFLLAVIVFFLLMAALVSGCAKLKEKG